MDLALASWLPRSNAVNLLAGAFLLSALYALGQRRAAACVNGYAWNSVLLGLIAALVAATTRAHPIWAAAALILVVKGWLIPRLLRRTLARLRVRPRAEPLLPVPAIMLLAGVLVVVAFSGTRALFGAAPTILRSCLPVSIATALVGMLMMIVRRQALLEVVGLVLVENGIFLAAVSLTYGMPLVVEMGVLLDLLAGVALLGLYVGRIEESFESAETGALTSLRG